MLRHRIFLAVILSALPGIGCSAFESPSHFEEPKPEHTYEGLAGQSCAIMVFADWPTRVEYGQIQGDLAKSLQKRLEKALYPDNDRNGHKPAAQPGHFLDPLSVVRYQKEHPETERLPIEEVAPRLNVARVIYIEVQSFSIQAPGSLMVLKGSAAATLRILEISSGKAVTAFTESDIKADYPRDAPEGVAPTDKYTPHVIYTGTIDTLADRLAARIEG